MTPCEFRSRLEDGLGRDPDSFPDSLVFTFIARRANGIGVRPEILAHHDNGEKVYGITRKVAERWLKKFGDDLLC